jgi:TonB family protein
MYYLRHSRTYLLVSSFVAIVLASVLALPAAAQSDELIKAAGAGDVTTVKALLAAKVDANGKSEHGITALMAGAAKGDLEVVQVLLAATANVNAKADDGVTALMGASLKGNLKVVQALLAAHAYVNACTQHGETALIMASQIGHLEVVQALVAAGADVNARLNDGGTALMAASGKGDLEVVRALLTAKADVNATSNHGGTALIAASYKGYVGVVQALLDAKADVNAQLEGKITAAMAASAAGHTEVVRLVTGEAAAPAPQPRGSGNRLAAGTEPVYHVSSEVSAPKIIYGPDPKFPEEERGTKHQGVVVLQVIVGSDGQVHDARVDRSLNGNFDEKAMEAVRSWRFEPSRKNGQPVAVEIKVEIRFKLY